jgi:hypothetical protein
MIKKIEYNSQVCSIVISEGYSQDGIKFFTENGETLQLGYMKRPAGYKIRAHIHKPVVRSVEYTNEVLFIKRGKVKVSFLNEIGQVFSTVILCKGDTILLLSYGHGFEMIEESEILEVKQGPYAGENDKRLLDE